MPDTTSNEVIYHLDTLKKVKRHFIVLYQGRPNGRSRIISKSIMLESIFRPRTRQLIEVVVNKLWISFVCIIFIF